MKEKMISIFITILIVAAMTACGDVKASGTSESETPETTALQASEPNTYGINKTSTAENTGSEYEINDMIPRLDQMLVISVEDAEALMKNRTNGNTDADTGEELHEENKSVSLVVYFSRAENIDFDANVDAVTSASINLDEDGNPIGNLYLLATYISEETGADIFSIRTEEKYPTGYRDTTNLATEEKNENARPPLSSHVDNINDYDVIYLGYPNWWGTLPMPVASFLEEYDFTGKTIIPFASHEGSGLGSGISMIKDICPEAEVLDGFAIRGGEVNTDKAREAVAEFIAGL